MINKDISQKNIVTTGRISTFVFLVIGCLIAPILANPALKGIFTYLQEFQGFISPGILAAFAFGLIFKPHNLWYFACFLWHFTGF